jgi:hypothetical protein
MLQRRQNSFKRSQQFIDKAEAIREDHPEMSCRKMALILRQPGWGRDKTEALLMATGFRVIYPPNYTKTTHSVRFHRFGNLIEGMTIKGINKVMQRYYLSVGKRPVLLPGFYNRRILQANNRIPCQLRPGS